MHGNIEAEDSAVACDALAAIKPSMASDLKNGFA